MKRIVCILSTLCLLLSACGGAPVQTTEPVETTAPIQTTVPVPTTVPEETTMPAQTTVPPETTQPAAGDYVIRIEDPETMIWAAPGFVNEVVALVEEAGAYTIVEEAEDADGNLWGRLKSGLGWVCLTSPALVPIHADYAGEDFNAYHAYWYEADDYITSIGITPAEVISDVEFGLLDWFETESWQMAEVLYTMDALDPDHPFLAQVVFWGDMTTYGISFTDADGARRHYALSISGKDGSLICTEYAQ